MFFEFKAILLFVYSLTGVLDTRGKNISNFKEVVSHNTDLFVSLLNAK